MSLGVRFFGTRTHNVWAKIIATVRKVEIIF